MVNYYHGIIAGEFSFPELQRIYTNILLIAVDRNSPNGTHTHLIYERKLGKKVIQDTSKATLGISNTLKAALLRAGRTDEKFIGDLKWLQHATEYILKKEVTYKSDVYDEMIALLPQTYQPKRSKARVNLINVIESMEEATISHAELVEFREAFPSQGDWLSKVQNMPQLHKSKIDYLGACEKQWRKYNVSRPPVKEEYESYLHNAWLVDIVMQVYKRMQQTINENGVGCAIILSGSADTCKSTICRIVGHLLEPFQIWTGTQWLGNDNLRWDTCNKIQAQTLITEEMKWQVSMGRGQTLEETIDSIKEQLTGAGANNRTNKSGAAKTEDVQSNLKFFMFSMNETDITFSDLVSLIVPREDLIKRFVLLNLDNYKNDIKTYRELTRDHWKGVASEIGIARVLNFKGDQSLPLKDMYGSTFMTPLTFIARDAITVTTNNKFLNYFD